MSNVIIKRDKVLKALRKEKLNSGFFFGTEQQWDKDRQKRGDNTDETTRGKTINPLTCKVCAVGSVLRSHLTKVQLQKLGASKLVDIAEDVCEGEYAATEYTDKVDILLREENYLGALSVHFETQMRDRKLITKHFRNELCKFVSRNFPKQFKVSIYSLTLK